MTLLTNAVPLLWLIASAGAFLLVFRPKRSWPVVATPIRALSVFVLVFVGGAMLVAVTRPDDASPSTSKPAAAARVTLPDPALVRAHPERYLRLDRVKVDRGEAVGGKPGAVLLTGGLINTSGLPIRDPRLTCDLLRGEIKESSVSTTIAKVIPAGGRLIVAAIDAGRVSAPHEPWERWECAVVAARAD